MSGDLYGGIDAGGTGTRCIVADANGTILGRGEAGPGNALISGEATALAALRRSLTGAVGDLPGATLRHLHISAAGTIVPAGAEALADRLSDSNASAGAFAGALIDGPGMIVIAGTGSACYGEDGAGRSALVGGWGPLIGDEGSAFSIGRAALRTLTLAVDGRADHTSLTLALRDRLGVRDRRTLQDRLYTPPIAREEVATLAALVAGAAEAGDEPARRILEQAGEDLGAAAGRLAEILGLHGTPVRVAPIGGVFNAGPLVMASFERSLRRAAPEARIVAPRFPAVVGALILAYRAEGVQVDEALLGHLDAGLAALPH